MYAEQAAQAPRQQTTIRDRAATVRALAEGLGYILNGNDNEKLAGAEAGAPVPMEERIGATVYDLEETAKLLAELRDRLRGIMALV
jgi:hypothetical protein